MILFRFQSVQTELMPAVASQGLTLNDEEIVRTLISLQKKPEYT